MKKSTGNKKPPVFAVEKPHAMRAQDIVAQLRTSVDHGLNRADAAARLSSVGRNKLMVRKPIGFTRLVFNQFESPVVLLLIACAFVAFGFGEWKEGVAVVLVLLINGTLGLVTELRAVRSMEALRVLGSLTTRLRRDGHAVLVPAEKVVPGDMVILEAGDIITADMRLIEASNLSIDESALTGESVAVDKGIEPVSSSITIAERTSMAFKGTHIVRGSGLGVVVATGMQTELGHISKLVQEATPEQSPIERQLARLSGHLIGFTLVIVAGIGALGIFKGQETFLMIEASIALAVAAIPEGLPVVATIALARGMWRMAKHNALVERLAAVETLGATTVIFTDKTGTLTENVMRVKEINCPNSSVTLADEQNAFVNDHGVVDPLKDPCLDLALTICVLCNNAELGKNHGQNIGDPLEQALLVAAKLAEMDKSRCLLDLPRVREIAFDSDSKMMATVHSSGDKNLAFVKGAPEAIFDLCSEEFGVQRNPTFDNKRHNYWKKRTDNMADGGLRVLALAMKTMLTPNDYVYEKLTFVGLIGFYDPPRPDVSNAIAQCRSAGIRVIMMTGDHAVTARNIANAVQLSDRLPIVVDGRNLPPALDLKPSELKAVREADVFARVTPEQKLALITIYQRDGHVVAMTGDGVNDAPALKKADIGVAMGLRGTQVAKEAAAMVLRDDSFSSIVAAIREGRVIFRNIQNFVTYLLSCNLSEVLIVGLAVLFGLPLPLLPLQILFLNLVTDVFPAFALAMSEGNQQILSQSPRDPKKPIITRIVWLTIIAHSLSISFATLGALVLGQVLLDLSKEAAVTVSFLTLAFAQLWHVFNMRSPRSKMLLNEVTQNQYVWGALLISISLTLGVFLIPAASEALQLRLPSLASWTLILGMSLLPLVFGQIGTSISAYFYRKSARMNTTI